MKTWTKAVVLSSLVELPLLTLLEALPRRLENSLPVEVIGWYHVPAYWFSHYVLLVYNPGPRPGPTVASNALAWFSRFAFQVLITTPVMYGLLRLIGRAGRVKA